MKKPVTNEAVAEYAARVRAGVPLGNPFPAPMCDCAFTEQQREVIRLARVDQRVARKRSPVLSVASAIETSRPQEPPAPSKNGLPAKQPRKGLSKLGAMLYLQHHRCFFCGEELAESEASIEHLNPKSRGGKSTADNEVVCHVALNQTFGNMDLKQKFEFVLKARGAFKCPKA